MHVHELPPRDPGGSLRPTFDEAPTATTPTRPGRTAAIRDSGDRSAVLGTARYRSCIPDHPVQRHRTSASRPRAPEARDGQGLMVMDSCCVALFCRWSGAGPFLSRTWTVKVKVPAKLAFPEMIPVVLASFSPLGRLPAVTDQL